MSFLVRLPMSSQASDTLLLADTLQWYGIESRQLTYQEISPKQLYTTSSGSIHGSFERLSDEIALRAASVASSWLAALGVPRSVRFERSSGMFIIHKNH